MTAKKRDRSPQGAPYAGRWVARVDGHIVSQGATPSEVRRAAQGTWSKEEPEISYVHSPDAPALSPVLEQITVASKDQDVYLVGGAVRDALLGISSHDWDIVTPRKAIELARRVAAVLDADFYVLDRSFDAARVIISGPSGIRDVFDFSSFRGTDVGADLQGRDFTINAIALDLKAKTTLDPLHGSRDLRERILRACKVTSMEDDPIRILRGVRLAASLDLKIEPATRSAMKAAAGRLPRVSPERQRDELFRILDGPRPDAAVRALEMLGVLAQFLPELVTLKGVQQPDPHVHDVWDHTLSVMHYLDEMLNILLAQNSEGANGILTSLLTLGIGRYRPQIRDHMDTQLNPGRSLRALLQFAALYHDVGKPTTITQDTDGRSHFLGHEREGASIAARRVQGFNLSHVEAERIGAIVKHHLHFFHFALHHETSGEMPSRRAIYRFFRVAGESAVDLILLGLADLRGTRGHMLTEAAWSAWIAVARSLLDGLWETPEQTVSPPRLIDGNDLMRDLGLAPGPIVGQLLELVREAQAVGEVTTSENALRLAKEMLIRGTVGKDFGEGDPAIADEPGS